MGAPNRANPLRIAPAPPRRPRLGGLALDLAILTEELPGSALRSRLAETTDDLIRWLLTRNE